MYNISVLLWYGIEGRNIKCFRLFYCLHRIVFTVQYSLSGIERLFVGYMI